MLVYLQIQKMKKKNQNNYNNNNQFYKVEKVQH